MPAARRLLLAAALLGCVSAAAPASAARPVAVHRAPSGETVRIVLSDAYARDPAAVQRWGSFMTGLVHGPELRRVTLFVATPAEARGACDGGAACYDPRTETLTVPGSSPGGGQSVEEIAAHEYGHHIAAAASNAPWPAYDWGTKRWASYEQVCRRVAAGDAFPGDEGRRYARNPGEGFAEAYRVLNGGSWSGVVDASFAPDAESLAALREDIVHPWRSSEVLRRAGSRPARLTFSTPLDGTVRATLGRSSRGRWRLVIREAGSGRVLARGRSSVRAVVCGQDAVTVAVQRVRGGGAFRLRVTLP